MVGVLVGLGGRDCGTAGIGGGSIGWWEHRVRDGVRAAGAVRHGGYEVEGVGPCVR